MEEAASTTEERRRQAAKAFLQFAGEVSKIREKAKNDIETYDWRLYPDTVDETLPGVTKWSGRQDDEVLLAVERQPLPKPPEPDDELKPWLAGDWRKADGPEALKKDEEGNPCLTDDRILGIWRAWAAAHAAWRDDYARVQASVALFNRLYSEAKKIEASGLRSMACAGSVFFLTDGAHEAIRHPLDVQAVDFRLETEGRNPRIALVWNQDEPARLRADLFNQLQGEAFSLEGATALRKALEEGSVHPFDPGEFLQDWKDFANSLSPHSAWFEEKAEFSENIFYGLKHRPVIWIQPRPAGIEEAVRRFMKEIDSGAPVPSFLEDLTAGKLSWAHGFGGGEDAADASGMSFGGAGAGLGAAASDSPENIWGEASGIDEAIYLAKPANAEQLRITKLLESSAGVLVQGPPGTGKTHTIANLIGHLLAKGKRVLVTSQKPQALAVLKDKLPRELQSLCVAETGDKRDVERTVSDFATRVGEVNPALEPRKIQEIQARRHALIERLKALKEKQFALAHREAGTEVFDGETWSLSKLGKWLHENEALASVIPFKTSGSAEHFPLTDAELIWLYESAAKIDPEDELLLSHPLPVLERLTKPEAVEALRSKIAEAAEAINTSKLKAEDVLEHGEVTGRRYEVRGVGLVVPVASAKPFVRIEPLLASPALKRPVSEWLNRAMEAGIAGGDALERWTWLVDSVKAAAAAAMKYRKVAIDLPVEGLAEEKIPGVLEAIGKIRAAGIEGEPGFFQRIRFKAVYAVLSGLRVNGREPRHSNEFEAVELFADLLEKRRKAERCWRQVAEDEGKGPAFSTFACDFPEIRISERLLPEIEQALSWWKEGAKPLVAKLVSQGIVSPEFDEAESPLQDPMRIRVRLGGLLAEVLPGALKQEKDRLYQAELEGDLEKAADPAWSDATGSPLAETLARAVTGEPGAYRRVWERIESLRALVSVATRRAELLGKLERASSEWAQAIRDRRPGFAAGTDCPSRVQDAWKWQRLNERFADYLKEDETALSEEAERLAQELRTVTVQLVSRLAWYQASNAVRGTQKLQTLMSWQTVIKKVGKGTGKRAAEYRARARDLLRECGDAVPVWIMPLERALNAFPGGSKFDVVIVDEASQSDVTTAPVLFLGKKVLVVGDDEQVSPLAIGVNDDAFSGLARQYLKDQVINWTGYFPQTSLYDLAKTTCTPLMLKEHFRCVPEIIGFCNELSYGGKILPLRDDSMSKLKPALVPWRVAGERLNDDSNPAEAEAIARIIKACIAMPEYEGKTFGVIVMRSGKGSKGQVAAINAKLLEIVGAKAMEDREIRVGLSADFQGDERDVVLLSLVDSSAGDGTPLRLEGLGTDDSQKKRWNVAVSRAKDQLWIVHSFDPATELKAGDLRRQLFDWVADPNPKDASNVRAQADSQFEVEVAEGLLARGYEIEQQHRAGGFFIDIVVSCEDRKVALECDGDAWHSDEEQVRSDMIRQAILERLGWRFVRLRGGEYFRNPDVAMARVGEELAKLKIYPSRGVKAGAMQTGTSDLLDRVKALLANEA